MTRYKIGDKVLPKKNLKPFENYGGLLFISKMIPFLNKPLTIKKINEKSYNVEENIWVWTEEMIEGLENKYKVNIL